MSHVPRSPDLPIERDTLGRAASTVSQTIRTALRNLRVASFWAAIVLPVTYLPLLAGGLTGGEALLFAALIAVNAGAFVLGHDHNPADAE
jgi:Cu/Ag efflux pump CusA